MKIVNIVALIIMLIIILIDQLSKYFVVRLIKNKVKITQKFELRIIKNYGAAFNILEYKKQLLLGITIPILIFLMWYLFGVLDEGYYLLKISLSFIIGGAVGNLIDRIARGYVIDFIYIKVKKFPIFNIADLFIFIGSAMVIYYSFMM